MIDAGNKEQKPDDTAESSSTGSDRGKGGGSGGGYSADYSSSDASSLEAAKGNAPEKQLNRLSLNGDAANEKATKTKEITGKPSRIGSQKNQKLTRRGGDQTESSHSLSVTTQEAPFDVGGIMTMSQKGPTLNFMPPQWNGVRIYHPMDPRIDLSTVSHIQTSSVPAFPSNVDIPSRLGVDQSRPTGTVETTDPNLPSIDQYMKLMEVIVKKRPKIEFRLACLTCPV